MKKPIFKFNTLKDFIYVLLFVLLFVSAVSLFYLPEDSLTVMAGNGRDNAKGLFGLFSRFV